MTRIRTWVIATTTQCTNHETIAAKGIVLANGEYF